MKTLFGNQTVFVIGNDYEITVYTNALRLCFLKIGDELFYDAKYGVMRSETRVHKFCVPQELLNKYKEYEVIIRGTIARKSYYSTFDKPEHYKYSFRPILKTENIKAHHIADSHYEFSRALKCAAYFGDETDQRSTAPHNFPAIVGSALKQLPGNKDLVGTALILSPGKTEVFFTDIEGEVRESFTLKH